jgi:Winged helix-turn helix/DDE superfamily endonuclease
MAGNAPRQLSFEFALWNRKMIRELIRCDFNVRLSVVNVGRLLRKLGLSPQRPLWRAYQQNRVAVERWKSEEYPAIRAEAAAVGATFYFGDEAGVRTDFHAGTTWAPVGQSLVVRTTGTRDSINLISALSAQGALRFSSYAGTFESATFINFCKRLIHDTSGTVFLIVDGHPVHRSKAVQDFVASTQGRLCCSSSRPTRPNSTPMSGSGRTSSRPHRSRRYRPSQREPQKQSRCCHAPAAETQLSGPWLLRRSKSALHRSLTCLVYAENPITSVFFRFLGAHFFLFSYCL